MPFTRPRSLAGLGREGRIVAQSASPDSPSIATGSQFPSCSSVVLTVTVAVGSPPSSMSRANTDVVEVAPEKARGQVPVVDANVRESDTVRVGELAAHVGRRRPLRRHVAYWFAADRALFAGPSIFTLAADG